LLANNEGAVDWFDRSYRRGLPRPLVKLCNRPLKRSAEVPKDLKQERREQIKLGELKIDYKLTLLGVLVEAALLGVDLTGEAVPSS
jgi:hypothetical protein